jgi:hypothetical protein
MRFLYQGFTHDGDTRSFTFQGIDEHKVETLFSIHVNLPLFARNKVSMQDAPSFCLQLLTNACGSAPEALLKLHQYNVLQEDLLPILMDRERRAQLKSSKSAPRRILRKPSQASQIRPATRLGV